jgi:hypothetical protein
MHDFRLQSSRDSNRVVPVMESVDMHPTIHANEQTPGDTKNKNYGPPPDAQQAKGDICLQAGTAPLSDGST